MTMIKDGKGRGFSAGVNSNNRLETNSVVFSEEQLAAIGGKAFAISSQLVSFTSSTESAILYIKNESTETMVVDRTRIMLGTVTGGTGDWSLKFLRNPTLGTTITNAVSAGILNINHGSSQTPIGIFYRGVQGSTLTDGIGSVFPLKSSGEGQLIIPVTRILPTGASFGVVLTPPTGTTAANATVVARTFYPPAFGS